ncbi:MAG: hypothetical protein J6P40_07370 [Oscillospiraceae bacterium]|nr:hypothetical protein [Oscillospiraceae bacterium]
MVASEARLRANRKYDEGHTKQIHLKLNMKTDADVIEKLQQVPSIQGYIKRLIRNDIEEGCKMKTYKIKPEFLDKFEGGDTPSNPERILTEDEVKSFSEEWDIPVDELKNQLIPQD